jgi:hypothetical protein
MNGGPPLSRAISLTLDIYVPQRLVTSIGDLDKFITGVCDGLMAAHPRADLDQMWLDPQFADVHPSRTVAIVDDREVVSITAIHWRRVCLTSSKSCCSALENVARVRSCKKTGGSP